MVYAAIKAALEEDAPYEVEFRTLNAEGVVNWVFTSAVVMREDGRPVRMMGGTMNITQRKEAEEPLSAWPPSVESSEDAIIAVDLTGIVTDWNEGAVKLFGYPEEEVLGNPIQMLLPDDRKEEEIELLGRVAKGERVEHSKPSGNEGWLLGRCGVEPFCDKG
jgi:PAS domain-containing protein